MKEVGKNKKDKRSALRTFKQRKITAFLFPVMSFAMISSANAQDTVLEEVVVTGIKQSLRSAAGIKQDASGLVDAITAEELGKFPDQNVAESLQRVPGVAIARGRGGDGRFITIRGVGEEFNAVTYNGRLLATENIGREFSFDNIASELVSKVEVYKSSETRLGDGSIGGRVDVVSAKPFDYDGTNVAFSVAGLRDELADDTGQRASGVFSTVNEDGTYGLLGSVNYVKRDFRVDVAESIDPFSIPLFRLPSGEIRGINASGADAMGMAEGSGNVPAGAVRIGDGDYTSFSFGTAREARERIGGTLAFQFRPTENFEGLVDVLYTEFKSPGEYFASAHFPCPGCVTSLNNVRVADNGVLEGFDYLQSSELNSRFTEVDTETLQLGFNGDWQVNDRLNIVLDAAWSEAKGQRDNIVSGGGSGSFYVIGTPVPALNTYNYTGGEVGNFQSLVAPYDPAFPRGLNPNIPVSGRVPLSALNDDIAAGTPPRQFRGHFTRDSVNFIDDTVTAIKLDGEYVLSDTKSIKFGFDYTDREKGNLAADNRDRWCNIFCGSTGFSLRGIDPGLYDAIFREFPVNDFLRDSGADVPNNFPTFTRDGLRALYAQFQQGDPILNAEGVPEDANGNPIGVARTVDFTGFANSSGADILTTIARPDQSNTIEEEVTGFYTQLDFDGELGGYPFRANAGLRVARTKLTSTGAFNQITNIVQLVPTAPDQVFTFSNDTPVSFSNTYTDVLPSFNIALDLSDQLVFRAGLAETISRPTLSNLTTVSAVVSTNLGSESIVAGNPELEPTRSSNIDLSLEYYGDNITASAALFYKDLSDTVANVVSRENIGAGQPFARDFNFTRPDNSDSSELKGLELSYVQFFESGLGYQANLTLVDSETTTADGITSSLENVSDLTYNVSGFYETDKLSVRLSYNFRDEYVREISGLSGRSETVDDYGQLDFTASYNINDNLTLFLEGVNLTDEDEFVFFDGKRNFLRYYEERGARYNFGIRGSF